MLDPTTFVAPAPPAVPDEIAALAPPRDGDPGQVAQGVREMSARARAAHDAAVAVIERVCAACDPTQVLAQFGYHGLLRTEFEGGEFVAPHPVMEHHAELLAAFALRVRVPSRTLPRRADIEELRRAVATAALTHRLRDFGALVDGSDAQALARADLRERVRTDWQAVRRVGYPRQIYETAVALWAPLEPALERAHGLRASGLVRLIRRLLAATEDRARAHRHARASLARGLAHPRGLLHGVMQAAAAAFPQARGAVERALADLLPEAQTSPGAVLGAANAALDTTCVDVFSFTTAELRGMYTRVVAPTEPDVGPAQAAGDAPDVPLEVPQERFDALLHRWSHAWGDLAARKRDHLFLANPVAARPLIRLGSDRWLLPVPALPLSSLVDLLGALVGTSGPLKTDYHQRRADFLEEEVGRLLGTSLEAPFHLNSLFTPPDEPGTQRETDVVVVVDSHLVIAEAKSEGAPEGAGRAGDDLRDAIRDLYQVPAIQASHAARHLGRPHIEVYPRKGGGTNTIDTRGVRRTVRLSITLDRVGTSGARWSTLRDAGLLSPGVPPTPTMHLWELQLVCDLLDTPGLLLHYLGVRETLERASTGRADEEDLLACYVRNGFSSHASARLRPGETLWGMSTCLAPYFGPRWRGAPLTKPVNRPERPMTPRWRSLVRAVHTAKPAGWSRMAEILLDVPDLIQREFETGLDRVRGAARRNLKRRPGAAGVPDCESFQSAREDAPWELMTVVLGPDIRPDEVRAALRAAAGRRGAPERDLLALAFRLRDTRRPYEGVLFLPPARDRASTR